MELSFNIPQHWRAFQGESGLGAAPILVLQIRLVWIVQLKMYGNGTAITSSSICNTGLA